MKYVIWGGLVVLREWKKTEQHNKCRKEKWMDWQKEEDKETYG